jgi:twitching motility protein PilJ
MAALMAVALLATAGLIYLQSGSDDAGSGASPALLAVSQAIPLNAQSALRGDDGAFDALQTNAERLGRMRQNASTLPGGAEVWDRLATHAAAFIGRQGDIETVTAAATIVEGRMPELLAASDGLLQASGATAEIQEFQRRAAAVQANIGSLATSGGAGAADIADDMAYLRSVTEALGGTAGPLDIAPLGAAARESALVPVVSALTSMENEVAAAVEMAPRLADLQTNLTGLHRSAATILDASVGDSGARGAAGMLGNPWLPIGLLGLAVLLLVGLAVLHSRSSVFEQASREQAAQNERNQQAILRLLDELGSLADGDLTVEATVTEDITGAIADSINYAIEKLRELVATINDTAIMVDSAAKQTASTATHMARAAETQTREIAAATESIVSMAGSIEEVSGNAERSSDVARHSVEVAHKGGEAVRRTIDGMNTIRETIQETSKRIKRLGESSQEIGNIIELINDIAEQTNILALNASIQASMAGEAGRGFAVVADEVQRLAERSTNATKQIEVLVRTIQSDTNEAVVSMERSTTDVVGGALLAENAGAALDEIEQVSNQIASLVQNISGSARQQAGSAADVTRRTTKLKEISDQTGKATTATAASISKLSELASQLRETVDGFTLPSAALQASTLAAPPAEPAARAEPRPAPPREEAAG